MKTIRYPQKHNCCPKKNEPLPPQLTCTENFIKCGRVVHEKRADRKTDIRHVDRNTCTEIMHTVNICYIDDTTVSKPQKLNYHTSTHTKYQ